MKKKNLNKISLTQVSVTDAFWSQMQHLIIDTVIPYQEKILNDEIPGVEKATHWLIFGLRRVWNKAPITAWSSRTAM